MELKRLSDDVMTDYASGALAEPVALAVATHIALNGAAQDEYRRLNSLGGALLEDIEAAELAGDALDRLLDRLDTPGPHEICGPDLDAETERLVPRPLRAYLAASLTALPWKKVVRGVEEFRIKAAEPEGYKVALLRIGPGRPMPRHGHLGVEYTVVLDGAYDDDGDVRMERGDICAADRMDKHQPIADPEQGCLCLIVLDRPLKISGLMGAIVNPFLRH